MHIVSSHALTVALLWAQVMGAETELEVTRMGSTASAGTAGGSRAQVQRSAIGAL
jgi:hypothetical protein